MQRQDLRRFWLQQSRTSLLLLPVWRLPHTRARSVQKLPQQQQQQLRRRRQQQQRRQRQQRRSLLVLLLSIPRDTAFYHVAANIMLLL
jgi:hypothetical protein